MGKLSDYYYEKHEEITDLEFELIRMIEKDEMEKSGEKLKKLKEMFKKHFSFEESFLFPMVEDKTKNKIMLYLEKEHAKILKKANELEEEISKENINPKEALKKSSKLQASHNTHINLENEYFHPFLNGVDNEKAEKIIKQSKKEDFSDYKPPKISNVK